jgi:hypothetical protein
VHDHDVVPRFVEAPSIGGCRRRHPAAYLEHDPGHVVYRELRLT